MPCGVEVEVAAHTNGAQFLRAHLHVHSYGPGGSYDVKDPAMTPEGIVDAAVTENLRVIAIADHNAIGNVERAVRHAQGNRVFVVPAVEVSTADGHSMIYCPTVESLQGVYGKLDAGFQGAHLPRRHRGPSKLAAAVKPRTDSDVGSGTAATAVGPGPAREPSVGIGSPCSWMVLSMIP